MLSKMWELLKKLLSRLRKSQGPEVKGTKQSFAVVTPMKPKTYMEIQEISETFHDIMLKTARFIKVNSNLMPLTGISHSDMQFLSGIPTTSLLSMSGILRFGVNRDDHPRILDFRPGGLLEFVNVSTANSKFCSSKMLESSCMEPEMLLSSWFRHVVNGYKRYLPVHNCALITTSEEELNILTPICKKVGLHIACTSLDNVTVKDNHELYYKKEKIDIIIRTSSFYEMTGRRDILHDILEVMRARNIITINPIEEFIANSRSLHAIAWHLHETNQFYTLEEHAFIDKYMIPTYIIPREDGPLWLLQYFGDDVTRVNNLEDLPDDMLEDGELVFQYRGVHDYTQYIEAYLIGNKSAGCVYVSAEGDHEYTFLTGNK